MQNENNKESQELHSAPPPTKSRRQNGSNNIRPLAYVETVERSLEMKPTTPNDSSSLATNNRENIRSWGLIWKKKKHSDNTGIDFRKKNIQLKNNPNADLLLTCNLCHKGYNSALMYVRCETCHNWYHAEAVELDESKLFDLVGFRCCKCRRLRSPVCPYTDPDEKAALESKKQHKWVPKKSNAATEPDSGSILKQHKKLKHASPDLPVQDEDHHLFSRSGFDQVTESKCKVDVELTHSEAEVESNNKESPTRLLLLQGQELHSAPPLTKSKRQNGSSSSSEMKPTTPNDSSSSATNNRKNIRSWGLIWKKKKHCDNTGIDFRIKNIQLKNNPNADLLLTCNLCHKGYNSALMYVCCETCHKWYHGEALELDESKVSNLVGFRCCKCRRIRCPVCPFMDPEDKMALESKKRVPKKFPPQ